MTSFTAADLKLGGRLIAACDAMGAGHLTRAAGIFAEISDDLNAEALTAPGGLLAPEDDDDWSAPLPPKPGPGPTTQHRAPVANSADLQMCARNVHAFGPADPVSGWRTCGVCGQVNITGPSTGPIDLGATR
jgi:hypothetical protein